SFVFQSALQIDGHIASPLVIVVNIPSAAKISIDRWQIGTQLQPFDVISPGIANLIRNTVVPCPDGALDNFINTVTQGQQVHLDAVFATRDYERLNQSSLFNSAIKYSVVNNETISNR